MKKNEFAQPFEVTVNEVELYGDRLPCEDGLRLLWSRAKEIEEYLTSKLKLGENGQVAIKCRLHIDTHFHECDVDEIDHLSDFWIDTEFDYGFEVFLIKKDEEKRRPGLGSCLEMSQ